MKIIYAMLIVAVLAIRGAHGLCCSDDDMCFCNPGCKCRCRGCACS